MLFEVTVPQSVFFLLIVYTFVSFVFFSEAFVKLMLENQMIDINKEDEDGLNAFWIAARCGHGDIMRVLAEAGINIYNTDKKGNNALHLAARFVNRFTILQMLVSSRYDLNLQNNDGDTATHIAA